METLKEKLKDWRERGLLEPPARPADVKPIPPIPDPPIQEDSSHPTQTRFVGRPPVLKPPGAPAPGPAPGSVPAPAPGPAPGPVPFAAGGPAIAAAGGAIIAGIGAGLAVFFYSKPLNPAWMAMVNPITHLGYANEQEYQWVGQLSAPQKDYLRLLWQNPALAPMPAPVPSPAPVPKPVGKVGPGLRSLADRLRAQPDPSVWPVLLPDSDRQRQSKKKPYPLLWPKPELLPPPFCGNYVQIYFVRTKSRRDAELAKLLSNGKWIRANDAGVWGRYMVAHHIIPLFLGGPDSPSNVILWNAVLHRVGHDWLNWQPQMLIPPPPLPPLQPSLLDHPKGTRYKLIGFKEERNQMIPSIPGVKHDRFFSDEE
jgi:hypothetical protein